jgi:PhnB protein
MTNDKTADRIRASFAPQLIIKEGAAAIEFYQKAFGAILKGRWDNPDGTVHVAEMELEGTLFHIREESISKKDLSPKTAGGITTIIGVFVDDPYALFEKALKAGGIEMSPVTDYEYGYRQGSIRDPFGHHWLLEKKLKE